MYNFPYFGFPYYRNYYYKRSRYSKTAENNNKSVETDNENSSSTRNSNTTANNEPYFNILGIDLYSDDILILCILFFLYHEEVKDEMLFISLILLLLS